jgi:hypothetical protein
MKEKFSFPGCNAGVRFRNLTGDLNKSPGTSIGFFGSQTKYESFYCKKAETRPTRIGQENRGASYVTDPHGHAAFTQTHTCLNRLVRAQGG